VLVKAATFAKDSNIRFEDDDYYSQYSNSENQDNVNQQESKEPSKRDDSDEESKHEAVKSTREESKHLSPSKMVKLQLDPSMQSPYKSGRKDQSLKRNSIALSKEEYSHRLRSLRKDNLQKFEEITDEELAACGLDYIPNEFGSDQRARLSGSNQNTFRNRAFVDKKSLSKNDSNVTFDKVENLSEIEKELNDE
jgi:hypothetical protein